MFIPVGEWLPDQPDFNNPGSSYVLNVLPITEKSYGPLPSLSAFSGALDNCCQGAFFGQDASGNANVFAGDSSKLYRLTVSSATPSDVSKSGGYTTSSDSTWNMAMYGQRIVATNFYDPIQSYVIGTDSAFSDLSAGAPKARYIAVVKDWVAVANTYDPTDGNQPQRVWWCALDDPTSWPTPGSSTAVTDQSDYQDLPGDHGWIQGIVGNLGNADAAIFFERAVYRMVYQGSPVVFAFEPAQSVKGTPAPGSVVQLGAVVYYLGEDGFYSFDGLNISPIGNQKIDRTFYGDLDENYLSRISGTIDPVNKLVVWAYPGSGNTNGNPNKLLIYNWAIGRWSQAEVSCERIVRTLSFGYSLDTLDNTGFTLDTLPFSLDSRAWTGNKVLLSVFDTNHKLSYFTGSNLQATVDTTETQVYPSIQWYTQDVIPARRSFVTSARPIVDGGSPTVAVGVRERQEDAVSWGSAVAMNSIGECPQRATGRYVRSEIVVPAGSTFSHIQGVDLLTVPAGRR